VPGASQILRPDALDGQVVLVTGGGTNLGRAAAQELHAAGATVVIAGRRPDVLDAALPLIGDRASAVPGDIRSAEGAQALVAAAVERHGRLDALVNNAGGQYFVPAEDITAKGWAAVQRLNVEGTLHMTEAAVAAGVRTVVDVTVSPHHGMPAMAHTGAARATVEAMAREQADRWADRGVAVICAAIGRFDTESLRKYPDQVWRGAARSVPLQRLGTMAEFGHLVAMLCTPLGRALSGSVVTLDGAVDNWWGPWPPADLAEDDGTVPTETRRPAPPSA
jgi:citronellol/citronellal dehydrogenase